MSRDLSKYLEARTSADAVFIEGTDERLLDIVASFDAGKLVEAADQADALADEGIFDIRPMSYVLYAAFRAGGIEALGPIFDVLLATLGPNFAGTGPQNQREAFFAKRLIWLVSTISDNLAYYKKNGGAEWKSMREGSSSASIVAILERAKSVQEALAGDAYAKVVMTLATLTSFLRTLAEEMAVSVAAPAPKEAVKPALASAEATADEAEDVSDDEAPRAESEAGAGLSGRKITLEVSPQFLEFLAKLRAFEALVKRRNLMKAAIVAQDVQNILENFDPRAYFPELFSRFSELLCENADEISMHIENSDSFAWKTYMQFYRVDLEKFVQGK